MPRYGDYETSDEEHRSARAVLWRAQAAGGRRQEVFAVKVCQPSEWAADEAEAEEELATFADAARELEQMGRSAPAHWVPVLGSGADAREAWFVTRFHARSLERAIDGRVPIDGPTLHWIVQSIVTGLASLERECRRPHGNLKPSNIFIDGSGPLRGAPLLLSDMKPRRRLALPADRIADFHSLGRIVVQLVRRRRADMNAVIGWPLERSGEWKRFGRHGEGWLALCNTLLNPTPTDADLDYERLSAQLRPLGRGGRKPWVLIAAAGLPVCAVAGALLYLRVAPYVSVPDRFKPLAEKLGNEPPDTATVPPEWGKLCGAYYEWLGEFLTTADNPVKAAAWARDPYLKENVLAVIEAAKTRNDSFDPRKFDRQIAGSLPDLQANPPDVAKKGAVVRRVVDAYAAVQRVQAAIEGWPARARLSALATRLETNGWKKPAEDLRGVVARAAGPALKADAISRVLATAALAERTESLLAELGRQQAVLGATGDPVLKGLADFYRGGLEAVEDVPGLNRRLAETVQDLGRKVALVQNDWPTRIAHDRFLRESFVHDFTGGVTAEAIERWEQEVQDYYFVQPGEDTRQQLDFPARFRAIAEAIKGLVEEERAAEKKPAAGEAASERFRRESDAVRKRLDALLTAPLVRKDREESSKALAGIETELRQLEASARGVLFQLRPDATGWLARVAAVSFGPAGSPLAREWDQRRGQLLAGADAARLGADVAGFRQLRERYRQLEVFFAGLAAPGGLPALAELDRSGGPSEFERELSAAVTEARSQAETELLGLVRWEGALPRGTVEEFLADDGVRARFEQQRRMAQAAAELGRDYARMAELLGQGAGLGEGLEATAAKWRARPEFASVIAGGALGAVSRDIEQLQTMPREVSAEKLAGLGRSPRLAVALAAWKRLGDLPAWTRPENLGAAAEMLGTLGTRIDREVRAEDRRVRLRGELAQEAHRQWRTALHGAHDAEALGEVAARREEFGVREAELSGRERFNLLLLELKRADWFKLGAVEAAAKRDEVVGRIRGLPGVSEDVAVQAWLRALEAVGLGDKSGGETAVTALGPGAVGWSGRVEAEGRRVRFHWRAGAQEHELVFQLVESEKAVPFFLCADELPVGLFIDVFNAKRAVATQAAAWLANVAGDDDEQRAGPQVWRYNKKLGLRLNDRWTGIPLPAWPKPMYPDTIPAPGVPDRRMPLQYIPPAAAATLAREAFGCRLPSPDEWLAAVEAAGATTQGANLRDETWQRENEFLTAGGVALDSPIDGDIFWPAANGALKRGRNATVAAPQTNDGVLWFSDTGQEGGAPWHQLIGNVAELLQDPGGHQFYVAGGSALSPAEIDPLKPYPVDPLFAAGGFSDVGLRLAFDAPASLTGRQRLNLVVKNQPFLEL